MSRRSASGRLSVDDDGLLTYTRPDAEGGPDEFARLGPIEHPMWRDLDAPGLAEDHERLLAGWRSAVAEGRAERRAGWSEFWATR